MILLLLACSGVGPGGPPADPDAVPDFQLKDLNPSSPRAGETISPRDYLGVVSGWYFIEAT